MPHDWKNKLYFGDNLQILREHIRDESVDLIYLDPPFNSAASYNILFQETSGEQSEAQITAFEDTWHWTHESESTYHEIVTTAQESLVNLIQALRSFLGTSDMMAYLTMMSPRLVELHRVLKDTGSIYLHCDPTASHYLKMIMDAIFGADEYRNEIIWKRSSAHSDSKQGARHYGRVTDTILFYAKAKNNTWNQEYVPYDEEYINRDYRRLDEDGRRYRLDNIQGPGGAAKGNPYYEVMGVTRYWRYSKKKMEELIEQGRIIQTKPGTVPQYKRYLDEMHGLPIQNLWDDIPVINNRSKEKLGYPTQKPEALLERILKTSSNENDVILDPFCGCGTTVNVAERLHRRWIGIDITHLAISLIKTRLHHTFKEELAPYEVIGEPKDLTSAEALALQDRYQFQWWTVGLVEGRPAQDKKKGKDTGIDGYIYFFDDNSGRAKRIIIQIKSGNVKSGDIRDLKGVLEREKAEIGAFISLKPATKDMNKEALSAGFYESAHYGKFPKLQILTIEQILSGEKLKYPQTGATATFKQAERQTKDKAEQSGLF
jgi:DNA modification methylase